MSSSSEDPVVSDTQATDSEAASGTLKPTISPSSSALISSLSPISDNDDLTTAGLVPARIAISFPTFSELEVSHNTDVKDQSSSIYSQDEKSIHSISKNVTLPLESFDPQSASPHSANKSSKVKSSTTKHSKSSFMPRSHTWHNIKSDLLFDNSTKSDPSAGAESQDPGTIINYSHITPESQPSSASINSQNPQLAELTHSVEYSDSPNSSPSKLKKALFPKSFRRARSRSKSKHIRNSPSPTPRHNFLNSDTASNFSEKISSFSASNTALKSQSPHESFDLGMKL